MAALANVFKIQELRRRLLFTISMLAIYRVGIFVTTPGVNRQAMQELIKSGGLFGMFNLFSGGALEQFSIFALGIMPYISSSIILQLLTVVVPTLEKLQKEGEAGRQKINQYTRYGNIMLSIAQGYGIARFLENPENARKAAGVALQIVQHPGLPFELMTVLTLTAGSTFVMWLGEQVTERGIGNGISLLIFAGIVARMPAAIASTIALYQNNQIDEFKIVLLVVLMLIVVGAVVFCETGYRRIPVQYAKRVEGQKMYGGQSTHLPLKFNTSGVMPPIFASSILLFPTTLASWFPFLAAFGQHMNRADWLYNSLYVVMTIFFAYFYTAVTFNPIDVADNMKKNGGYIPGIRPGKKTAEYIDRVLSRVTFGAAIYLSAICVLPNILQSEYGITSFRFGGTALLIVVGVALDTVQQIEAHLITRHYEGFITKRGPRIRRRAEAAA
ncbi:MAG: preprotein translocase subunit SecY [Isosphaeraceae bacterium]